VRKLLYWYVPVGAALIAAAVFADGFYSFVRGNIGTAVNVGLPSQPAAAQAPRDTVVPVILGDSLARGTGDQSGLGIGGRFVENLRRRQIKSKNITNLGINGARTADLLQQLDHPNVRVVLAESNAIIISIGGNDLWGDNMRNAPMRDPEPVMNEVLDRVEKVVHIVRKANPNARVYVVGLYNPFVTQPFGAVITPLVTRWNAKLIDRFAADRNLAVVETTDVFNWRDRLSFDRFHPNDEGYEIIARRIADTF
jgi:lysophospholipase L1-like esterase